MVTFSIAGVDFGLCFVTKKEETIQRLYDIAYENHIELEDIADALDMDILSTIVSVADDDVFSKTDNINNFLKELKAEGCWLQDRDVLDDHKVMIFYHKETLA